MGCELENETIHSTKGVFGNMDSMNNGARAPIQDLPTG
jgi:hypothetical protein